METHLFFGKRGGGPDVRLWGLFQHLVRPHAASKSTQASLSHDLFRLWDHTCLFKVRQARGFLVLFKSLHNSCKPRLEPLDY